MFDGCVAMADEYLDASSDRNLKHSSVFEKLLEMARAPAGHELLQDLLEGTGMLLQAGREPPLGLQRHRRSKRAR